LSLSKKPPPSGGVVVHKNVPIRVKNLDTPEIRTHNKYEKLLGLKAREVTYNFLMNSKEIILLNCTRGKYFRLVCKVKNSSTYLSAVLKEHNLSLKYDGGTKSSFYKNLTEEQYKNITK